MSKIKEYNALTGEEIVRDMTEAELAQKTKDEKGKRKHKKKQTTRAPN